MIGAGRRYPIDNPLDVSIKPEAASVGGLLYRPGFLDRFNAGLVQYQATSVLLSPACIPVGASRRQDLTVPRRRAETLISSGDPDTSGRSRVCRENNSLFPKP